MEKRGERSSTDETFYQSLTRRCHEEIQLDSIEKGIWNSDKDRSEAVKLYFESLIEIELGNNKPLLKEIKGFLVEAKSCQK